MSLSRRTFVRTVSLGGAGVLAAPLIGARGHEAWARGLLSGTPITEPAPGASLAGTIRLSSNENPHGPAPESLAAIQRAFDVACRYPRGMEGTLADALAAAHGVRPENVLLGAGSGEVLRMACYACLAGDRALVTAAPSFEDPVGYASLIGAPVHAVPVTADLALDLAAMAQQAEDAGAGLVFLCNPNNPTGTVHGAAAVRAFIGRVNRASPSTTILVDEAYHEYVHDPSYASMLPLALENPRVIVARTFSKIHGMAGLRVGYAIAQADTLAALRRHRLVNSVNVLASSAALAALSLTAHVERQRALNDAALEFTRRWFVDAGFAVPASQTNFVMVHVRRDSREFQRACQQHDVLVGRPFPPLHTHARVSIGTMDEMRAACDVFRRVLST